MTDKKRQPFLRSEPETDPNAERKAVALKFASEGAAIAFTDIKINSIMDGPNLDTKFPLEKGSGSGRKSNFILKNKIL